MFRELLYVTFVYLSEGLIQVPKLDFRWSCEGSQRLSFKLLHIQIGNYGEYWRSHGIPLNLQQFSSPIIICSIVSIDLFHNGGQINYSFVLMLKSPTNLATISKFQKNFQNEGSRSN